MNNVNLLWFLRYNIVNDYKMLVILENYDMLPEQLSGKLLFQQNFLNFLYFNIV